MPSSVFVHLFRQLFFIFYWDRIHARKARRQVTLGNLIQTLAPDFLSLAYALVYISGINEYI